MLYEKLILDEKRGVSLTVMAQEVGGEFRGIDARPAVLILPGGGYRFCSDREAEPVALPYLKAGFQAFILRYGVLEHSAWPQPLEDYEAAMSLIRARAADWHVIPDKIAVIGFSAGGHLAGAAATMSRNRPNAAILGYAVLREDESRGMEKPGVVERVDEKTCPCFLFATRTDSVVPIQNTLDMLSALNRFHTSFECHIYAYGPHGFSTGDHAVQNAETLIPARASDWVEDSIVWLRELFGDFGRDALTAPVLRAHVNDDGEGWLSLDCSIGRIFGNPEARRVLAGLYQELDEKLERFAPGLTLEDMLGYMSRMTLRELLCERKIATERFDELDAALRKVPNI